MSNLQINFCPGTLASGFETYSHICLKRMFNGRKVNPILPYESPNSSEIANTVFFENVSRISISGVQVKFSLLLEKNKLRLINEGEQGSYILKPIPIFGKNGDQMPANEHLTMQIAHQIYGINTAENALIFFNDGIPAYITKRFDVAENGSKWANEDFASIAGKTAETHGEHFKYLGNYFDLFELLKKVSLTYRLEAPKLFKLLVFNYLYSNGDAHLKNFSLMETPLGDFRLSPAYDLLNTRLHIIDSDFALEDGLLPRSLTKGTVLNQFQQLAQMAELNEHQVYEILGNLLSNQDKVADFIKASFLSESAKRNYLQAYQTKYKKLAGQ